jgi:hypothetical protein
MSSAADLRLRRNSTPDRMTRRSAVSPAGRTSSSTITSAVREGEEPGLVVAAQQLQARVPGPLSPASCPGSPHPGAAPLDPGSSTGG